MTCVKTGARVYLVQYNQTLPADLHRVDGCIIVHMNMALFDTKDSNWSVDGATHIATLGVHDGCCYFNKGAGILVVPAGYVEELPQ